MLYGHKQMGTVNKNWAADQYHIKIKDPPDNYRGGPIKEGGKPQTSTSD